MKWLLGLFSVLSFFSQIEACTAFQLKSQDGANIYCRTMEFGFRLDSNLLIVPRGTDFTGTAPIGKPGMQWKTKYGYVGMNQAIAKTFVSDGMNERGLVVGALYLNGFAEYEKPDSKRTNKTLGSWEVPSLILGACATIEDAKALLDTTLVADEPMPLLGDFILPLHYYICDPKGRVLVVEYVKGKRFDYDNPLGVLTNSPPFEWHLNNLSNYVHLSPYNTSENKLPNYTINNINQGSGLLGIPGDYTPPSRFVRAAFFSQFASTPKNANEAVLRGFHILNTFDIFEGIVRTRPGDNKTYSVPTLQAANTPQIDITEWIVLHDRNNLRTYFRYYDNLQMQMVDLRKIDFSQPGFQEVPIVKSYAVEDVTYKIKPLQMNKP